MKRLSGTRVLLVEDEAIIALDHADHLIHEGAEIIGPFANSDQALRELDHTDVDVAVIDFVLRDSTTAGLQDELARRKVPFVIVTAYPKVLVRQGRNQMVLGKPVSAAELCETVETVCAAR